MSACNEFKFQIHKQHQCTLLSSTEINKIILMMIITLFLFTPHSIVFPKHRYIPGSHWNIPTCKFSHYFKRVIIKIQHPLSLQWPSSYQYLDCSISNHKSYKISDHAWAMRLFTGEYFTKWHNGQAVLYLLTSWIITIIITL